jgi:hypothetical protein
MTVPDGVAFQRGPDRPTVCFSSCISLPLRGYDEAMMRLRSCFSLPPCQGSQAQAANVAPRLHVHDANLA